LNRIDQEKFDDLILPLLRDCFSLSECDCNTCPKPCIIYQELHAQNIDDIPDILNTLRELFLEELIMRMTAIIENPRYNELSMQEFNNILSNKEYFRLDLEDDLIALF
jgi:hypothetical protein